MNLREETYFLSDFHLGAPDHAASLVREKIIVKFLDSIKDSAKEIFLLGDMFDFWYEYKSVVPKGYVRLLGKLAELTDSGIKIHFFVGNHDMWMQGYFEKELNIKVYYKPEIFDIGNKKFYIAHGDGLGPGDSGYKFMKKVFRNKFCRWLFGALHPHLGIGLANYFSRKSRAATGESDQKFLGADKEWLIIHSNEVLKQSHYDYFVYGHRHLPLEYKLNDTSTYVNLGDWIKYYSYAVFDGEKLKLEYYKHD